MLWPARRAHSKLRTERFETHPRLTRGGVPDHQDQAALVRGAREPGADDRILVPGT